MTLHKMGKVENGLLSLEGGGINHLAQGIEYLDLTCQSDLDDQLTEPQKSSSKRVLICSCRLVRNRVFVKMPSVIFTLMVGVVLVIQEKRQLFPFWK